MLFETSIIFGLFLASFVSAEELDAETLLEKLDNLKKASDCTNPKYARKDWDYWHRDGMGPYNTRKEVLLRQSLIPPSFNDTKIISGKWNCRFTNKNFTKPNGLSIDHLVPLKEAHKSGSCNWDKDKKEQYANDLREGHLIAIEKQINSKKGHKDPGIWIPPNTEYLCEYLSNWVTVKERWDLWVDQKEEKKITEIAKKNCPTKFQKAANNIADQSHNKKNGQTLKKLDVNKLKEKHGERPVIETVKAIAANNLEFDPYTVEKAVESYKSFTNDVPRTTGELEKAADCIEFGICNV